ncbi:MAG: histone deacetylase family protein [Chthoniobacterales bacterium]
MVILHDERCAGYGRPGHPERPQRILATVPVLKQAHPDWKWIVPEVATRDELLRAHSAEYLAGMANPRTDFDSDCPAYPHISEHAARAAGAATGAARTALTGERAFSLMRPPGHHALRDQAMGFCYFGSIALAAMDALGRGVERVAIWDFDAHHGNGTESLVANEIQIRFASIHQYPGWPGSGTKSFANIHNYPIAPYSPREQHVQAAARALEVLLEFQPQLLLVSAGFDAYVDDPITQMTLERDDFATFGKWLRELDVPAAAVLEGGYSDELPELIDAFLIAWEGRSS